MNNVHVDLLKNLMFKTLSRNLYFQVKELPAPYEDSKCREYGKTLEFFPTYSSGACGLECFAAFTLKYCGCKLLGITGRNLNDDYYHEFDMWAK